MPDLHNHSVTSGSVSVQVGPTALSTTKQWTVSGVMIDSTTGASIAAYNFTFPQVLVTLTTPQLSGLMDIVNRYLITCQTGY